MPDEGNNKQYIYTPTMYIIILKHKDVLHNRKKSRTTDYTASRSDVKYFTNEQKSILLHYDDDGR